MLNLLVEKGLQLHSAYYNLQFNHDIKKNMDK